MVSAVANPALKTIYNDKSLRENYSDLDLNEVVYEGMIGALLGNFGGAVDIARTARGNVQNGRLGSGGTLGEKKLTTPYADVLRNAELTTPYTNTENSTQLSTPYADALTQLVQQQQQGSAPGSDVISRNDAAGEQIISYAEAARRLQAEEEATAGGVDAIHTAASEYAHYKELERKYLNGNIKAEEFEELRRLDNIWGQFDAEAKENGRSLNDRYRKLEQKFRNGNITEQELHEWIALEDSRNQPDGASEDTRYEELKRKFIDDNINEQEWNELLRLENDRGQSGASGEHTAEMRRAWEKENSPRKTLSGKYGVSWDIVQGKEYEGKFEGIAKSEEATRAILTRARWALSNRDGKRTEEIYAIDAVTGKEIARIANQNINAGVVRTAKFEKSLAAYKNGENIILIHNHPAGMPPSDSDINALYETPKAIGVVVGHDGSVYVYGAPQKKIEALDYAVANRKFKDYTKVTGQEKALQELSEKFGFWFERM